MSEYPRLEFRCSHALDDEIFSLLARREFQEMEITKSCLLKKSLLLGLQIIKSNPSLLQHIHEHQFLKGGQSE